MAVKLTRLTHKIATQLHLMTAVPFAVLVPGGQSGNFWIHPHMLVYLSKKCISTRNFAVMAMVYE
jgi:hypothetical protein